MSRKKKVYSVDQLGNGSSPQTLKGAKTVPAALKIDDEVNFRIIFLIWIKINSAVKDYQCHCPETTKSIL